MTVHLVDTSAWIEYLRGTGSAAHHAVAALRADPGSVAVTQPVVLELRAGASQANQPRLERIVSGAVQLDVDPHVDFDAAGDLHRAARAIGRPVRSTMDCVIAAVAIRRSAVLVHADRDYDTLAAVARELVAVRELPRPG